jgi:AcrR family transcriptional regulator
VTPRPYRMSARAHAVAETRERIVSAATALHAERGVLATRWEDIAERAEVAPATVYRHFPSLVELIPACARSVFDIVRPPTLDEAAEKFAALDTPSARMEQLVRDSCHCYERGEAWLHASRREQDLVPAMGEAVRMQEASLDVLVRAALGLGRPPTRLVRLLCTLADFPFWKALVDNGVARPDAEEIIVELVTDQLGKAGLT